MGEDRTEGAQGPTEYVSVGEAAKLLGVHRNTVHHRIKAGRIKAHKVVEGEREVYRIERDSLGVGRTDAHVRRLDAQRTMAGEELAQMIAGRLGDIVREHMQELGDLREQLGGERARREMAEERITALEAELEVLRASRALAEASEGAEPRSSTEGQHSEAQATERPEERQASPWWRRWFGG